MNRQWILPIQSRTEDESWKEEKQEKLKRVTGLYGIVGWWFRIAVLDFCVFMFHKIVFHTIQLCHIHIDWNELAQLFNATHTSRKQFLTIVPGNSFLDHEKQTIFFFTIQWIFMWVCYTQEKYTRLRYLYLVVYKKDFGFGFRLTF